MNFNSTTASSSTDFVHDSIRMLNDKLSYFDKEWTSLVLYLEKDLGLSEMLIFLGVGFIIHGIVFQGLNLVYAFIHHSGLFKKYKIQQDRFPSWEERVKIIPLLFKHRIVQMVCSVVLYYIWKGVGGDIHTQLPTFSKLIRNFFFAFLFLETWFYWGHRAMHEVSWLRSWHKTHHEFQAPVGLAAEYADWREDIFVNFCSTTLGILLCGCHPLEFYFFISFRLWETVDVHSGYALPFTPFRAELHDYHHMRQNGCYGAFFMDELFGTEKKFKQHLKKKRSDKL